MDTKLLIARLQELRAGQMLFASQDALEVLTKAIQTIQEAEELKSITLRRVELLRRALAALKRSQQAHEPVMATASAILDRMASCAEMLVDVEGPQVDQTQVPRDFCSSPGRSGPDAGTLPPRCRCRLTPQQMKAHVEPPRQPEEERPLVSPLSFVTVEDLIRLVAELSSPTQQRHEGHVNAQGHKSNPATSGDSCGGGAANPCHTERSA